MSSLEDIRKKLRGERCACQAPAFGRFKFVTPQTIVFNTIEYCDGDIVLLCQNCKSQLFKSGVRGLWVGVFA